MSRSVAVMLVGVVFSTFAGGPAIAAGHNGQAYAAIPITSVRHFRHAQRVNGDADLGRMQPEHPLILPPGSLGRGSIGSEHGGWFSHGWGGTRGGPGWGYGFGPNLGGS